MTSIDLQSSTSSTNPTGRESARRKSLLFCPVCGHESPADEDWLVIDETDRRKYVCPDCERVVASR